jgi:KEOPS complex subunit Cgi121
VGKDGGEVIDVAGAGIGGGRIPAGKADDLLSKSKALAAKLGIEILLMDADLILGKVHIESALEHASRAFERGRNAATTKMLEVMLYASGERQLSSAIEKMGVKAATTRVAVVVSEQSTLADVFQSLDIERDDGVLEGDVSKLANFGIAKEEIECVGKEKACDLVLERVARVDLLK